ncbi:cysteine-rich CWC family protein [Glaciimonas sp. PCH181]|uniref:cysteine-rich CWC family protein n=1 Tax=Glaciimonas sp. PCH181 TaxID=2133943 RepID=UPI001CEDAF74|nr:cysteine-rich CWC family protein [Glaciimonas sp. PCH181]
MQCPICNAQFSCGAATHSTTPCWCQALPVLNAPAPSANVTASTTCYCPTCLQHLLTLQPSDLK